MRFVVFRAKLGRIQPKNLALVARAIRNAIRANRSIETPSFITRQADSHESLEFPIRANHATKNMTFSREISELEPKKAIKLLEKPSKGRIEPTSRM